MSQEGWERTVDRWNKERALLSKRKPYVYAAVRLQKKLIEMGYKVGLPERLRPGRDMKSAGAWVWRAVFDGCAMDIGSGLGMCECLKLFNEELKQWID